jgi:carboxyl-terminal processing protease
MLMAVDGVDFVNATEHAGVAKINAGLFPETAGESHRLTVRAAAPTST